MRFNEKTPVRSGFLRPRTSAGDGRFRRPVGGCNTSGWGNMSVETCVAVAPASSLPLLAHAGKRDLPLRCVFLPIRICLPLPIMYFVRSIPLPFPPPPPRPPPPRPPPPPRTHQALPAR